MQLGFYRVGLVKWSTKREVHLKEQSSAEESWILGYTDWILIKSDEYFGLFLWN